MTTATCIAKLCRRCECCQPSQEPHSGPCLSTSGERKIKNQSSLLVFDFLGKICDDGHLWCAGLNVTAHNTPWCLHLLKKNDVKKAKPATSNQRDVCNPFLCPWLGIGLLEYFSLRFAKFWKMPCSTFAESGRSDLVASISLMNLATCASSFINTWNYISIPIVQGFSKIKLP